MSKGVKSFGEPALVGVMGDSINTLAVGFAESCVDFVFSQPPCLLSIAVFFFFFVFPFFLPLFLLVSFRT